MVRLLLMICVIGFLHPLTVSAFDDNWKFFKPNNTTEEDVIAIFGTPDSVAIHSSYENLKKAKEFRRTDMLSAYQLIYTNFRGDLNILKGPLGQSASTKVWVEDGKVVVVDWDYAVKYKAPAEALWKSDKGFETKVAGAITIGRKKLSDGNILYVTCSTGKDFTCDGTIQASLSPDPEKK